MRKTITTLLTALMVFCIQNGQADCCRGKIDVGATLIKVDVLESGNTVDTMYIKAFKADATVLLWQGFCLKPGVLLGKGDGEIATAGLGLGYYIPVGYFSSACEGLTLIPSAGVAYTYLSTHVDLEIPGIPSIYTEDLKETFKSFSPYIAVDICYKLTDKLTLLGMIQYAWARTHTHIESLGKDKSHSQGPNYALGFDYSLNNNWSITGGAGYNISLSKEKHGLRAIGGKLGVAYYF